MEILEELRTLQRDYMNWMTRFAAMLFERAGRLFLPWRMGERERYLEQALGRVQDTLNGQAEDQRTVRYFASCSLPKR